mmetsp:Transcript_44416/g.118578  ORF Transcript_44416/g.118578 Transcript_44416/m.118578 type:complete len:151 (-) Transcript_44416:56-508(-)
MASEVHRVELDEVEVSKADIDIFNSFASVHVVAEGTLEKRGFWNPAWKLRYFTLDNKGRMFYYKSKEHRDAGKFAGMIALTSECSISRSKDREGRDVCFELNIPANGRFIDRTFYFSAPSEETCVKWVDVIERVKDNIHYVCFPGDNSWW